METFPSPERLKTETLSREFSNLLVETKIRALLGSVNKIKEVESLEVKGSGNEIILNTTILVKTTPLTPAASVNISAILENAGGAIAVKK